MANKRFKTLPTNPVGDDSPDHLYHAVGHALSQWERLQETLSLLFGALVQCDNHALFRAFGTQMNTIPKLVMMKYAARDSLHDMPDLLKKTNAVLDEIDRFTMRRNDIAHASVLHVGEEGIDKGFYLAPGMSVTKKIDFEDRLEMWNYRWTADQVAYYSDEFIRLREDARELAEEIQAALTPSP